MLAVPACQQDIAADNCFSKEPRLPRRGAPGDLQIVPYWFDETHFVHHRVERRVLVEIRRHGDGVIPQPGVGKERSAACRGGGAQRDVEIGIG